MNDPNEGIETLIKWIFIYFNFFIEMNDPNEGIETYFLPTNSLFIS